MRLRFGNGFESCDANGPQNVKNPIQPAPKYHTEGCLHSFADSPGARTLVLAAFEPFHSCELRASTARTPSCAILWRSPTNWPALSGGMDWRRMEWSPKIIVQRPTFPEKSLNSGDRERERDSGESDFRQISGSEI